VPILKTQAILIKSKRYKERDKLLTFFTEENGKIFSLCKGARVPLNKWGSSAEPPNLSCIQLYQRNDFFTLTEIKVTQIFSNILSNFERLIIFSYIVNILDPLLPPLLPSKKTFYLTLSSLYALNNKEIDPISSGYIFAIKFLSVQGYGLETEKCLMCGRRRDEDLEEFFISYEEGGFICEICAKFAKSRVTRLSKNEILFLKKILSMDLKDIPSISEAPVKNNENLDKMVSDYYNAKFKRRITGINELIRKYDKRSKKNEVN